MGYTWEEFLYDTWCEINGGGVVTQEQTRFMDALRRNKKLQSQFEDKKSVR